MQPVDNNIAVIILAAGMGKRMKSDKAKVLHEVLGKPMIMYVLETAINAAGKNVIVVIGNQAEKVQHIVTENCREQFETVPFFALQEEQSGTGHAVMCALPHIPPHTENVIVLCGDVPLITYETVRQFADSHIKEKRDISVIAVELDDPKGYGRVLFDENMHVTGIVEEADATGEQRKINTVNTGIYCINKEILPDMLQKVKSDNAQGEVYLTDIIKIGNNEGKKMGVLVAENHDEFIGVNTAQDLIKTENIMYNKRTAKIS
ncbi:MAG: NTP transferase domain-containing protein [Desulfobacterales bacterium]|nr:NTP transferase domain-containing protein [Desulfobacterales bacterium]